MKKLCNLTIAQASKLLEKKEISAVELTKSCLKQIDKHEAEINAFITRTDDIALKQAKNVDKKRADGKKLSPLAGIPYSLKDVFVVKDVRTTAGSNMLNDYIPPYSSTVYNKLHTAGAVLLGKTNCDPFGFGSSTENSAYGVTKNPVNTDYVPGGSSGGSAAAVAYGGGLFSIGEDTGGSIRCPSAFCGTVGLKPTYGLVSRYGSIAYASSYDSVGGITKTVEDNAILTKYIAGHDAHDATSSPKDIPEYLDNLQTSLKGKTIGVPKEYFVEGIDKEVNTSIRKGLERFEKLGVKLVDISLPYTKYAIATYYVIGLSEASSNLARFDGIRYGLQEKDKNWKKQVRKSRAKGFSTEAKRRIMVGTYTLSAGYIDQYYNKAQKVRSLLRKQFADAFEKVDVIITPTMPTPAFKLGENIDDPLKMWLMDAFTVSINPVGLPALSVPSQPTHSGLPIGMQLIAPHFREDILFNFGHTIESYG